MKRINFILALAVTALLGTLTASAQEKTTYIKDLLTAVYSSGYSSSYTPTENMNEGINTKYHCIMLYQTTNNFRQQIVKDFLVVQCNGSLTEFTYNGLTYKRVNNIGYTPANDNLNYDTNGPELYLFVTYCTIGNVGDTVLSKFDVDILDSKPSDTSRYAPVMVYNDGNLTARDDKDIKKDAGGKYVYLKPTYTTITEASCPMIYMETCTKGSGTEADPYQLSSVGHLYWFAYMVATGHNSICGKLINDITVNEGVLDSDFIFAGKTNLKEWFAIGYDSDHAFTGKLMGDGHTVSGLYRDDESAKYVGLIGYAKGAEVTRMGVTDAFISGGSYVGGIGADFTSQSIVKECFFQGTLCSNNYCGGIGGVCSYSQFVDCYVVYRPLNQGMNCGQIYGMKSEGEVSNCYFDSDISGSISDYKGSYYHKTSEQFASGEVASILNHEAETGQETFHQKIGTDKYPVFTITNQNYVFKTDEGDYTNKCTHPHTVENKMLPATCINEGYIANSYCIHPVCQAYYIADVPDVKYKQTDLVTPRLGDIKPVVYKEKGKYLWQNTDMQIVNSIVYYNVMQLELEQYNDCLGTYSMRYPVWPLANGADLYYQIKMNGVQQGIITLKFLVNKVERTEYRQEVKPGEIIEDFITLEDITANDQLEIDVVYKDVLTNSTGNKALITIATNKPFEQQPAEHQSFKYNAGDDCLHEGLIPHFQCERCGALFAADIDNPQETDTERFKTDEYEVTEADLYHPAFESHLFTFSKQSNGLYADLCNRCNYIDTESWVAKEAINGEDLHLIGNDNDGFTADENLDIALGNNYAVPVAFTAQNLQYTATTYAGAWNSWSVPFEVTTTELANAGFEAAYIEGIHRYDTDDDGTIDRTTLEVIRIKNGRLRAGTPYLIHPQGTETKIELNLTDADFKASSEIQPGHTETMIAEFDFIPTYSEVPASEAAGKYYIVGSGNKLGLTTGHVPALDWYLTITPKGTIFDELPAEVKSISIRVVGEEDDATGIVTHYADNKVREEIYDLSGRRINSTYKGIVIKNGKKYLNK